MLAKTLQEYFYYRVGNRVQRGGEAEVNIAIKPPWTLNIIGFSYFESSGRLLTEAFQVKKFHTW